MEFVSANFSVKLVDHYSNPVRVLRGLLLVQVLVQVLAQQSLLIEVGAPIQLMPKTTNKNYCMNIH